VDVRGLRTPVFAYAGSRLVVVVVTWVADVLRPDLTFFAISSSWDGPYYYGAATDGYPPFLPMTDGQVVKSQLGFFPLYPMVVRALAWLPGVGPLDAGVALSLVCGLVATVLVWWLADAIWDRPTADRSAILFAFFPASFVFSMLYSEGLMLALSAGCLLALHRQRWLLAGVLGALATATRPNAIALVPAAAVAAFVAIRSERRWSALLAPALAPLGFVAFHVFLRLRVGIWDAYERTQSAAWGQDVYLLATPTTIGDFLDQPFQDVNITIAVVGLLLGIAGFVLLVKARPPAALLAYVATILVISLSSEGLGLKPRFLLTAFPLVYGVAHRLRPAGVGTAIGAEAALLGALSFTVFATILTPP
jgi:hypothetical protein